MIRRRFLSTTAAAAAFAMSASAALAKDPAVYTGIFSKQAVSGYDPVAYFTESKPVKGDARFNYNWRGAEWRFTSAENRDKFIAAPEKFAPQFGGYCAWAVSEGTTASADPKNWRIVNDKLYLNYDDAVQKKWELDVPGHISRANKNWPNVLGN